MEQPEAQTPTAEATDSAPAPVEASASEPNPQAEAAVNASINDALRSLVGIPPASTSNLDPSLAVEETAAAATAEPAPADAGDVSAAGQEPGQVKPGRRASKAIAANETIESLRAETERLRQEADARVEQARADERARIAAEAAQTVNDQQFAETEARLQRLMATPDHELSGEDYQWREEEKSRRLEYATKFPQAEAHYRQQAEARITTAETAFTNEVRRQLTASASLPGVDVSAFKKLTDWGAMAQSIHAAGAESVRSALQPEIERLKAEIADLKLTGPRGLGATRVGVAGGRSDSAPPVNENDIINAALRRMAGVAS